MNAIEWEVLVRQHFDYLFQSHGFEISEYSNFKNKITLLESQKMLIRMILDKMCLEIYFKHKENDRIFSLFSILKMITHQPVSDFIYYHQDVAIQLEKASKLIKKYQDEIFDILENGHNPEIDETPFQNSPSHKGKVAIYGYLQAHDRNFRKSLNPEEFSIVITDKEAKTIAVVSHTEETYFQVMREPGILTELFDTNMGKCIKSFTVQIFSLKITRV